MLDPILSLSFSLYSNKGAYALLLGSGVSRSSGIPTGWEVLIDLIKKIAQLKGEKIAGDPIEWFTNKFKEEPSYSTLISQLAKKPEERKGLLKSYFEPTEQEKEEGIKTPTQAHKAIAKLVSLGYIKVIITTNFDRLIERALEQEGIIPTVISTPDMVVGSSPLYHNRCTVIKVNGDYLDSRMRNTIDELESYEKETEALLKQVLNEYGLVICGWSGEWDNALVSTLTSRSGHRFSSYWTIKSDLNETSERLVKQQAFDVINIVDADNFFQEILDKVVSLKEINAINPISPVVAAATIKRYLVDDKNKIKLHDYILQEAKELRNKLSVNNFPLQPFPSEKEVVKRIKIYEESTRILQALFISGFYWVNSEQIKPFIKAFDLIVSQHNPDGTYNDSLWRLSHYPGLLLFYSAGIACLTNNNYKALQQLLILPFNWSQEKYAITYSFNATSVVRNEIGKLLRENKNEYTPVSNHLFEILREPLKEILIKNDDYQKIFDRFEYLLALSCADLRLMDGQRGWGNLGQFAWRNYHSKSVMDEILEEYSIDKQEWIILKSGLFGGSQERFIAARRAIEGLIKTAGWNW